MLPHAVPLLGPAIGHQLAAGRGLKHTHACMHAACAQVSKDNAAMARDLSSLSASGVEANTLRQSLKAQVCDRLMQLQLLHNMHGEQHAC